MKLIDYTVILFGFSMVFFAIVKNQSITREVLDKLPDDWELHSPDTVYIIDTVYVPTEEEIVDPGAVLSYIETIGILHPDIVYAQAMLESGHLTSNIFLENHNCFGMKQPKSRPTLAIGKNRNHAVYNSWKDCILDYKIYQTRYYKDTTENYYAFLERMGYAESTEYEQKLKSI